MLDKNKNITIESCEAGDTEGLVMATQKAVIGSLRKIVKQIKQNSKAPGMTWTQLNYLLDKFEEKKPIIFEQNEPM